MPGVWSQWISEMIHIVWIEKVFLQVWYIGNVSKTSTNAEIFMLYTVLVLYMNNSIFTELN